MYISIIASELIARDEITVVGNRDVGETKTAQNGRIANTLKAGRCINYPDVHRARPPVNDPTPM